MELEDAEAYGALNGGCRILTASAADFEVLYLRALLLRLGFGQKKLTARYEDKPRALCGVPTV